MKISPRFANPLKTYFAPIAVLALAWACVPPDQPPPRPDRPASPRQGRPNRQRPQKTTPAVRLGWAIQAGAFSQVKNAALLSDNLNRQGLDATYFRDSDRLYKVRFGNFASRDSARERAEALKARRVLDDYYLVAPDTLAGYRIGDLRAETGIRRALISTAESYLGVPYLWGGTSADTGFDCSGLTQAVYKLNGLSIPRTSRDQYAKGNNISRDMLRGGDLLFFSGSKGKNVTHVAIYIENGTFIHAPSSGQVIRRDNLNSPTWSSQFIGAKSYL